jgi:hypothetical protein
MHIILVGKLERMIPVGRPRCGWEVNIKVDRMEIGWGSMDWKDLVQDRGK